MATIDLTTLATAVAIILGIIGTASGLVGLYFDYKRRGQEKPILQFRQVDAYYESSPGRILDYINLKVHFDFWVDNVGDRDTTISGATGRIESGPKEPIGYLTAAILAEGTGNSCRVLAHDTTRLRLSLSWGDVPPLDRVSCLEWDYQIPVDEGSHPPNIKVDLGFRHTHGVTSSAYFVPKQGTLSHVLGRASGTSDN